MAGLYRATVVCAGQSDELAVMGSQHQQHQQGAAQYSVEHRVIVDASGVRVQITKYTRLGPADPLQDSSTASSLGRGLVLLERSLATGGLGRADPLQDAEDEDQDDMEDELSDEAAFDLSVELDKLFSTHQLHSADTPAALDPNPRDALVDQNADHWADTPAALDPNPRDALVDQNADDAVDHSPDPSPHDVDNTVASPRDALDPNPDGVNPNMLPSGADGRPSDIRSLEGQPDPQPEPQPDPQEGQPDPLHDRVRMELRDDGLARDPRHVHRSAEGGSDSTTAVIRTSHVLRSKRSSSSSAAGSVSPLPPRSVFAKLAPSRDRYTILRDEL